ncbi:MAG: S8 family serine peptidase [Thermoanaerobaculia bacterium]
MFARDTPLISDLNSEEPKGMNMSSYLERLWAVCLLSVATAAFAQGGSAPFTESQQTSSIALSSWSSPVPLSLMVPSIPSASGANVRRWPNPIPGSYIVVLNDVPGLDVAEAAHALARSHGGRAEGVMKTAIKAFGFRGSEQAAMALSRNPHVAWVEEDAYLDLSDSCGTLWGITTCFYDNDDHWALDRIDQKPPINSTKSFGYASDGSGVRAYVVDTGVRGSHQEFGGRVAAGFNMTVDPEIGDAPTFPNEEVVPLDGSGANAPCSSTGGIETYNWGATHGTGVASVLGGNSVGVARGVTIVPVKVGSCYRDINNTQTVATSLLATARGLDMVLADVLSNSYKAVVNISLRLRLSDGWSSYNCESPQSPSGYVNCFSAIEYVVARLIENKIPVVASAGNDLYPAENDAIARMGYSDMDGNGPFGQYQTITVGGTEHSGASSGYADRAWRCNATRDRSPGTPFTCTNNQGSNFGAAVSIWAPAWNVRAALGFSNGDYRPLGSASSGTSFSAPLVAGAVARILQKYAPRTKTVTEIWQELGNSAANSYVSDFDQDSNVTNTKLLYAAPGQ